jgi:hypothetical protein
MRQYVMSKQQELRSVEGNEELNSEEIYARVTKDVAEKVCTVA